MLLNSRVNAARRRAALMGTAALSVLAVATPAQAQEASAARPGLDEGSTIQITDDVDLSSARPTYENTVNSPFGTGDSLYSGIDARRAREALDIRISTLSAHNTVRIDPKEVVDTPSITINNNFTTTEARDPNNITGIGQIITDGGGGSVGLCTGTLINRRTVIFAAHCVNSRPATAYGANSGGVGAAVAFETNTRANAAGQTDELVRWLFGTGPNADGRFQTNRAQQLYNMNQVFWNPASRAPASCTNPNSCFLEADIATGILDVPTRNVPTWTMLFSPLVAPSSINPANGTGYHVTIAGYGAFGNGTTGNASGSDFRRRIAENVLGGLTSINERNLFLFGTTGAPSRPQLLYWLDFDDPRRGQAGADPDDFNGFRDNALTREGLTGPGDSGGPLIIDQAFGQNVRTIIGVLSGGSTFFNGQPGGSYGTQSFYQPLFLYWDWIVANNPYRYVTANAGNRNWEDPTTWVTELDPAYQILVNGVLTNGVPTNLGGTNQVTAPQFGELCFQAPSTSPNPANNQCFNVGTRQNRNGTPNTPSGQADVSAPATADIFAKEAVGGEADGSGGASDVAIAGLGDLDGAFETPHNHIPGFSDTVRPAPTLANGLPGATNFVPNNVDGNRAAGTLGRYYDVTLRNAGIVTLSSNVTVDMFTVAGAQSQLTVASGGTLTSLAEINQMTGIVNVNGTITTPGDYFLMSGLLSGTGQVNTPFLTSVIGNIAPGTLGTIGTLTIGGNLVLSSGSTLLIDIGPNGTSDRLAVVAGSGQTGTANLGGRVILTPVPGSFFNRRNTGPFTFLTAAGGITGTFNNTNPEPISAILRTRFIYNPTSVQAQIEVLSYASVLQVSNPNTAAFAQLLDQNANNAGLVGLYNVLDLVGTAAELNQIVDALAPRTEALRTSMGVTLAENNSRTVRERLNGLEQGNLGGRMAYYGRRVQTAALALSGLDTANATLSDVTTQPVERETRLPETMSGFISLGYLEGRSQPQLGSRRPTGAQDRFDGFYGMAGLEMEVGSNAVIGGALSYSEAEGETFTGGGQVETTLLQGSLYGKVGLRRFYVDGQLSVGQLEFDSSRPGNIPGSNITLQLDDEAMAFSGEIGAGTFFGGRRVQIGPRVSLRYAQINFDDVAESGGLTALTIDREEYQSLQGRAGVIINSGHGPLRPHFAATYVHEFEEQDTAFAANFVGGTGAPVLFGLTSDDRDWGEISGGLTYDFGPLELSLSLDTTLGRDNFSNQTYRAGLKLSF
jgi:uncharacterized protein YhjY with autotransporter beta-barrel domain